MWKELADFGKQLFTLWSTVTRHEAELKQITQDIKDLQSTIRELSDSLRQLRFEVERDRLLAERDKEILQLRLELILERASKGHSAPAIEALPPPQD
jgi:predicted RNase H-like nuclease (RuvC/YqgF family)